MATPSLLSLTRITPTLLASTRLASTADQAVYTVPTGKAVKISQASIANVSALAVTVGVSIVPSGGAIDATHKVVPDGFSLASGNTLPLDDVLAGHVLGDGDAICVHAGTADAIVIVISGLVMQ